ncbi:MAG: hypothetical protein WBZ36_07655 [Candidatus Nitrosopolaris sp.]
MLSCQSYETSNAEENGNSLYTKYLIEGLKGVKSILREDGTSIKESGSVDDDGNLTPESLHDYVYYKVASITDQVPDLKSDRASKIILTKYPEFARIPVKTQATTADKKKEGIRGVDFTPKDDLILDFLHHHGIHVEDVLMIRGTIPDDKYRGQGERWFIQLNIGPSHVSQEHVTIYFNTNDAKTFKEKVEQSLKGQKLVLLSLTESLIVNPGYHNIDTVILSLIAKRSWDITLSTATEGRVAVIHFSERGAHEFSDKVGESLADLK